MNYSFLLIAGSLLFCVACNNQNPSTENARPDPTAVTKKDSTVQPQPYFPVQSYLKTEIAYVDSLPVGIKKYVTKGERTDSAYINPEEFHKLANEFINDETSEKNFEQNFSESSFFDRSTNNATFFYNPKNASKKVRRIDVVTGKGDVYDEVRSIYIEKNETKGDTSIIRKLMWKPKRNFQIITVSMVNDNEPKTELIKVVWDNRE